MKYVIHKGVAGFGDRFRVLARCIDLMRSAQLYVDWGDRAWNDDFYKYFTIRGHPKPELKLDATLRIFPDMWTVAHIQGLDLQTHGFLRAASQYGFPYEVPDNYATYDVLVACACGVPKYTDGIFDLLRLTPALQQHVGAILTQYGLTPGAYDCWHIRNTDKAGPDVKTLLPRIPKGAVLVTDDVALKTYAAEHGIICPSVLPPKIRSSVLNNVSGANNRIGGVHYARPRELDPLGMTRWELNGSVITDTIIAGLSRTFTPTCPKSAFGLVVRRMRKAGWPNKLGFT